MQTHVHTMGDSIGQMSTAVSIGTAALGTFAPHPLQYVMWGISILAGVLAVGYWIRKHMALNERTKNNKG